VADMPAYDPCQDRSAGEPAAPAACHKQQHTNVRLFQFCKRRGEEPLVIDTGLPAVGITGSGKRGRAELAQNSIQVVVPDAEAARQHLLERGGDAPEVQTLAWGSFTSFTDPDGNSWTLQLPPPGSYDDGQRG